MSELVTPEDLDAYLSGDSEKALAAAEAAVRAYCGWHVAPSKTETVTVDVDSPSVLLPSLHVTAVSSVRAEGNPVGADRFEWSQTGILWLNARGFRRVEVEMTHGYDVDSTAGVLLSSIVLATAARAKSSPSGLMRAQVGQVSETYSQTAHNQAGGVALLTSEKNLLAPYRLPSRP